MTELLQYETMPGVFKKITAGIALSACHYAPVNEFPSMDGEVFLYKCSKCKMECNVLNAKTVRALIKRHEQEKNAKVILDEEGKKKLEKITGTEQKEDTGPRPPQSSGIPTRPGGAAPAQPQPTGLVNKDGKIYENGKLIGVIAPLSDEDWYQEKFGKEPDEWARENLSQLRKLHE